MNARVYPAWWALLVMLLVGLPGLLGAQGLRLDAGSRALTERPTPTGEEIPPCADGTLTGCVDLAPDAQGALELRSPVVRTDILRGPAQGSLNILLGQDGEVLINGQPIQAAIPSLQEIYTQHGGTLSGLWVDEPFCLQGDTLQMCFYEQGGNYSAVVTDIATGQRVSTVINVPATLTYSIFGDGEPLTTWFGSGTPPAFFRGLNLGALDGDPTSPVDGDVWYDATADKFRCREGGTSKDCIGTGAGGGYATVQDEGTPLTQRTTMNFTGTGVTCVDNAGATRTDCTITGGGNGGSVSGAMLPPIGPMSAQPVTAGNTFGWVHVGSGAGATRLEGMGVAASIAADSDWDLHFELPPALPTDCTYNLRLWGISTGTGNAQVQPRWLSVAPGEDPSGTSASEGTTQIALTANQLSRTHMVLDADTLTAGEVVAMRLRFVSSGWTVAQISTWQASLVCVAN